jgi:hypothetical protein
LHKSKPHIPPAEDKIEVKDKDLFSYLYSGQLQSDGFMGFLLYVYKKVHMYILSRLLRIK